VSKSLVKSAAQAERDFVARRLPLVLPAGELPPQTPACLDDYEAALICNSYVEVCDALASGGLAGVLPDFLEPDASEKGFLKVRPKALDQVALRYHFAWNPRLLRLNIHAGRRRDALVAALKTRLSDLVRD
jgi:DNA-binding transcriptional LysR family regulator